MGLSNQWPILHQWSTGTHRAQCNHGSQAVPSCPCWCCWTCSLGSAAGTPDLKQKNHPLLPQEFSAVWFREVQGQRCKARADVHRAPGPWEGSAAASAEAGIYTLWWVHQCREQTLQVVGSPLSHTELCPGTSVQPVGIQPQLHHHHHLEAVLLVLLLQYLPE